MSARLLQAVGIAVLVSVVSLTAWQSGWLRGWENVTWDLRVRALASRETPSDQIRIVLLDQGSLDWGLEDDIHLPWPWPRETYAALADFCTRAGVRALAMDVLFTEPSFQGVYDDELLRDAVQRLPAFVVSLFLSKANGVTTSWGPEWPGRPLEIDGLEAWIAQGGGRRGEALRATLPIPELATTATVAGNVNPVVDEDSVHRRTDLFRLFDGRAIPSLGLATFLAMFPETPLRIEPGWFWLGDRRIPIDREARVILRYRGPYDAHETVSMDAVIQSEVLLLEGGAPVIEPAEFTNRAVFLGFSAPALLDLRPTPLSPVAPGVTVHATLLDNLLAGDVPRDLPPLVMGLMTLGLALLGAVPVRGMPDAKRAVGVALLLLPIPALMGVVLYPAGWWMPVVPTTLALVLAAAGAMAVSYAAEGRERAYLKSAFQHYLSPAVIDQLLEDPGRLQLGGERREVTMLFSDLQGFSGIAEALSAVELTALLNEYLSDMTEIILEESGTLDKYEGDAILAFWNAPLDQPDHAARAVRTARRCQARLAAKRESYRARTGQALWMRIGIHTGPVAVGNMGSQRRFDYTVLGDAANLASRLEGANKIFGTWILVSSATWDAIEPAIPGRRLGSLRVVGRTQPVEVFEPFAEAGDPPDQTIFDSGLTRFEEGDVSGARSCFDQLAGDPVAEAYVRRCGACPARADGDDWDPVWNLTAK